MIGGDSVLSIQQRLNQKFGNPSSEEIDRARIEAEDLFEVKVDIRRQMETLDPGGDWERRGARALDNPQLSQVGMGARGKSCWNGSIKLGTISIETESNPQPFVRYNSKLVSGYNISRLTKKKCILGF